MASIIPPTQTARCPTSPHPCVDNGPTGYIVPKLGDLQHYAGHCVRWFVTESLVVGVILFCEQTQNNRLIFHSSFFMGNVWTVCYHFFRLPFPLISHCEWEYMMKFSLHAISTPMTSSTTTFFCCTCSLLGIKHVYVIKVSLGVIISYGTWGL